MTETVWIVLIVAVAIVLLAFRGRLTNAAIEVVRGKKVKASMTAQPTANAAGPGVTDALQVGDNVIDTVETATIARPKQVGKNTITVRSATSPAEAKPPPR
jgi:hypothetical protein